MFQQSKPTEPSAYELAILRSLQSKHVYAGTVSEKKAVKRVAAFKAQKRARRINRGR